MSNVFYHDAENRIVITGPSQPNIREKKTKRGEFDGWHVTVTFDVTRADNYTNPETHQWALPTMEIHSEHYMTRDSREDAVRYFKTFKYPRLPEITADVYFRLRNEYYQEAKNNKPPTSSR